jgi:hypothetical protein
MSFTFYRPAKFIIVQTIILIAVSCGKSDEAASTASPTNYSCGINNYCIIFVSNTTTTGDIDGTGDNDGSNGIEEADTICNADSNKPNSSTYKAMIVDGLNRIACTTAGCSTGTAEHVDWVLQASTEYRKIDESTVIGITTTAGVFSFPLDNTVESPTSTNTIWTGLNNTSWTTGPSTCSAWTDGSVASNGLAHSAAVVASIGNQTATCTNTLFKLHCVEQ